MGIIYERQATAALKRAVPRSEYIAFDYLKKAMDWYEKAENSRPENNDESILRWNSCARMINSHNLQDAKDDDYVQPLLDV